MRSLAWISAIVLAAACGQSSSPVADAGSSDAAAIDGQPSGADASITTFDAQGNDAGTLPACADFNQTECAFRSYCRPACTGSCDCTCPGPKGYEGCGCGGCPDTCFSYVTCVDVGCPDPSDPKVHYVSQDAFECTLIDFGCAKNQTGFSDECGCGCIDVEISP